MRSTTTCPDYEIKKLAPAVLLGESGYVPSVRQRQRSAVIIGAVPRHHIGSSPLVHDRRPINGPPDIFFGLANVVVLPIAEQMQELLAALSLNKSQLARILRVTRPTIYEWLEGNRPNHTNAKRLNALFGVLERASVSSSTPLNARFVRYPVEPGTPSLVDLLEEEQVNENRLVEVMKQAQRLANMASERRENREDRLRRLGFEEPSREQRKEQLARNVALMDWAK